MRIPIFVLATMVSVIHALQPKSCQVVSFANSPKCRQELSIKLCIVAGSSPSLLLAHYGTSLIEDWTVRCKNEHQDTCPDSPIKTGFCTDTPESKKQWCYHYTSVIEKERGCENVTDCTDTGYRVADPPMPCCDFSEEVSSCTLSPTVTCSNETSCFRGTRDTSVSPAPSYNGRPLYIPPPTSGVQVVLYIFLGLILMTCWCIASLAGGG
jgi:hypothetical protein